MLLSVQVLDGFRYPDFDKKALRKGMRSVGADVRKLARVRISRKTVSKPGEPPGKNTGTLLKSITAKVSRSGFSVRINPKGEAFSGAYYPAFVIYGHRGPGTDSADQRSKKRTGRKVAAPRENFLAKVAEDYVPTFENKMQDIMLEALKK